MGMPLGGKGGGAPIIGGKGGRAVENISHVREIRIHETHDHQSPEAAAPWAHQTWARRTPAAGPQDAAARIQSRPEGARRWSRTPR
jgi:hypothetical protein